MSVPEIPDDLIIYSPEVLEAKKSWKANSSLRKHNNNSWNGIS